MREEKTMGIKHDFHLHSDFSGDCETPANLMIEQAISLGLEGICFTEHHDLDVPSDITFFVDFDRYFAQMQELRQRYKDRIQIQIGVEFGIQKHLGPVLQELLRKYPFDFVIASQHFVNHADPYYPAFFEGRSEQESYALFFQEQYETLTRFKDFNTLGHMDYVVRYGPNQNKFYTYETYADLIDPILRYLIENGKCLEINTGGYKYGLGQTNPGTDVLKRYRELGGELVTLGSDAHVPKYLGYEFERARELLLSLGFKYYTIFEQRRAVPVRLN